MRIAIYAERFPAYGGGISVAHESLGNLLEQYNDVRYYAFDDSNTQLDASVCRKRGNFLISKIAEMFLVAKVRRHASRGEITLVRKIARTYAAVRAMNRDLQKFRPNVVIVSDDQLPILGLNLPPQSKAIWIAHHNYYRFLNNPFLPAKCPYDVFLAHRLERRAAQRANFAVFPSRYMEAVFRDTLLQSMPGRVIPNYVRPLPNLPSKTEIRQKRGISNESIGIFFPSGGTDIKGARYLPEVIRRLRVAYENIFFCVSGPIYDSLRPELNLLADRVCLYAPGALPYKENLELAAMSDFCISPAILENYSCALLECQALGLPVITFNIGGNSEIIQQDRTGWVLEFNDIDGIIDRSNLLIFNREKRLQMANSSRLRSTDLTDPTVILDGYNAVWEAIGFQTEPA